MKLKKSQLKDAVKAIVRQCLNERCGGRKAKRIKEQSDDDLNSNPRDDFENDPDALAKSKGNDLPQDSDESPKFGDPAYDTDENMGADSEQTPMDDIVKHVIKKVPAIANNPQKIARVSTLLFQHQFGGQQPPDSETLLGIVQKHMASGGASEQPSEFGGMEEAGMTSENGGYDENEEIMLIKVMALIAKKLEAMHAGEGASPVGEPTEEPAEEPTEEPSEEPEGGNPFGKEDEPSEEPEEPEDDDDDDEPPIKEGSAKTQTSAYKVAPNPSTLTQKTDNEKIKPSHPSLTETSLTKAGKKAVSYKTQGAAYKVAPNPSCRVKSDDKDRREPGDPELTETQKKMKENHKVQVRSYTTVNDAPQKPENVRDPEVPQLTGGA